MEELKYVIEDSTIAALLGVQNFSTDEAAILELVKNAYDAKALNLELVFSNESLLVIDNGIGMNDDDIKKHWMHIGRSSKKYEVIDSKNNKRIQAGSKGVGRFALARLGRRIELITKKEQDKCYIWKTDWNKSTLDVGETDVLHGTQIIISDLREKWNIKRIDNLRDYLERTYNDSAMTIVIKGDNYEKKVKLHFPIPEVGINCKSHIELSYKDGILETIIHSDEFSKEAKKYCQDIDLSFYSVKTDMEQELVGSELEELDDEDLFGRLMQVGDFSASFFFNIEPKKIDYEKFLYKSLQTPVTIEPGIILYRNAFSISSYEGNKDWLGLGKRSRKSPAAASHPTGAWRVRENQLAGYVLIDKKENDVLQDMSNRQGLDENIYYKLFIEIILTGIKEFERYRQYIIRKIDVKNKSVKTESNKLLSERIIRKPSIVRELDEWQVKQLRNEISAYKQEEKQAKEEKKDVEDKYKYDVRILNVLATTGLKASSIAHELENDRNDLNEIYENVVDALKEYDMWEELNSPDNQKVAYRNIPYMLKQNHEVSKKLVVFLDTMLSEIEKDQFEVKDCNIYELVSAIRKTWIRDYPWVDMELNIDQNLEYFISEDLMRVVLDNLILNSVQQNECFIGLKITINISQKMNMLLLSYKDNGKGLHKKYRDNPSKILEVHETTRKKGHGLGMWIINNTIVMSGGEILEIDGQNGFKITMTIGDKNND